MRSVRWMRSAPLAALLVLAAAPVALAGTIEQGESYVVPAGEVVDGDVYAFASEVTIEGRIAGDLIAFGGTVTIAPTGIVDGDVMAAAQSVIVKGEVADDVRAAAFSVQVDEGGSVLGDLVGLAYNVSTASGSIVRGDILGAGYQGIADGRVERDLTFYGVGLELTGTVEGDVEANVETGDGQQAPAMFFPMPVPLPRAVAAGLKVAETARIGGDLSYASPSEAHVPADAVGGASTWSPILPDQEPEEPPVPTRRGLSWLLGLIRDYVALIVAGGLLALAWPRIYDTVASHLSSQPGPSLGWGCLTALVAAILAVALPLLALLLALFLAGIQLGPLARPVLALALLSGVLLTAGVYLLSWAGTVIVGRWTGRALLARFAPSSATGRWAPLLLGLAVVALLINLPWLGLLFRVLIACLGLGAVVVRAWPGRAQTVELAPAA